MDFDSSSKFISSLAKFLQSLCNGYVEFNSGVEVIGHIYLSVDTGKKIDYILNEKVCKTDENSVTFISNSFHAQPAEKPKLPAKAAPTSDPSKVSDGVAKSEDDIIIMEDPESKNVGTIPSRNNLQNFHQTNNAPLKAHRPSKRSFNQSFPYSSRNPAKHSRTNSVAGGGEVNKLESESLPDNNSSVTFLPQSLGEDTTLAPPSESEMSHLSKVFPQTFSDNVNSESVPEERDVKPQIDDDLEIVQVKQEYSHSNQGIEDQEGFDDSQDHSSYPSMPYDQYYSEGKKRGQRSDYSQLGGLSQAEYYHSGGGSGGGPAGDGSGGDSAGARLVMASFKQQHGEEIDLSGQYRFKCELCWKVCRDRTHLREHQNSVHFHLMLYGCPFCGKKFHYKRNSIRHSLLCERAAGLVQKTD